MRTIKFRGKRVDNGEWAYGYLYYYQCKPSISNELFEAPTYHDPAGSWIYNEHEIIPETVGQFTGLTDKNGVEIYEGDMAKIDEGLPVEVRYEKIYASFGIWRKGWAFLHYFHEAVEPENCEVIGNIHDNPELLK